jgi:integrase
MIRIRPGKRGTRYQAVVRVVGFPEQRKTFRTERDAKRWGTVTESSCIKGEASRSTEARRRTLGDAVDKYVEEALSAKRDARTRLIRLRWWKDRYGRVLLSDLTPELIVEARGKLARETYTRARPGARGSTLEKGEEPKIFKRSDSTVRAYLRYLGAMLTLARKEWRWMSHNPFEAVRVPSAAKGRVRYLSEPERAALLKETAKDAQLHALTVLALSTAARAGELTGLVWSDVELQEQRVLLRDTKNGQPRTAWLHGESLRLLKAHERKTRRRDEDHRVFESEKRRIYRYHEPFVTACTAAKVEGFHFHDLRHSAATYMARLGASEQQLKAIGGWKSGVVSRYVHLAAQDAKNVVAAMNEKFLPAAATTRRSRAGRARA